MENTTSYIVSARKYRPQLFSAIVGQEHVTNTLKNSILTNQIAQAYLFFGPRGVGKTTCARVFAKTINCLNLQPDGEACNECTSCKAFNTNTSFNIYELDAASNNSVEDIRQLIDQVRYPPQLGKYKVYIIDEVHMLSAAAFNAFLKTLEEPPSYAKFILATTEKNKVLPTILSRCQVFNFNRIKTDDIARYLEKIAVRENHRFEPEALKIIAQKSDGALRDACSIYDQMVAFTQGNISAQAVIENLHVLDYDYYFQLTDAFLKQNYAKILLLLDNILDKGFDPQNILTGLIDHIRYLLLAKDPQTLSLIDVSDTTKNIILTQSKECNEKFLLNALNILNKADINYRAARHQQLHLEIHLLQIANLQQALLESEKKNLISSNTPSLSVENPANTPHPSTQQSNKKTSDKPVLNAVTIGITSSLSEIKKKLSETIQPDSQVSAVHQNILKEGKISEDNPSYEKNSTRTESLIQEKPLNTPKEELPDNIIKEPATPFNTNQENKPQSQSTSRSKADNHQSNNNPSKTAPPNILTTTEQKYQALLMKNPLLEELKVKLKLEFK